MSLAARSGAFTVGRARPERDTREGARESRRDECECECERPIHECRQAGRNTPLAPVTVDPVTSRSPVATTLNEAETEPNGQDKYKNNIQILKLNIWHGHV